MKSRVLLLALLTLFLLVSSTSYGQFRLAVGPTTGMNFNIHTGSDIPQSGSGIGFVIGGEATMKFTPTIGMISRIQFYDNRSGGFSNTRTVQSQAGENVAINVDASNSLAYIMFEELFMLKLPNTGLFFVAGPCIGFNVEGSNETTEEITTPGFSFDGQNSKRTSKNSIKETLARFELKFGAGYDIPISKQIAISPNLTFGFGLTKVISNVSYRILTFQALTTVKFLII